MVLLALPSPQFTTTVKVSPAPASPTAPVRWVGLPTLTAAAGFSAIVGATGSTATVTGVAGVVAPSASKAVMPRVNGAPAGLVTP